MPMPLFMVPHDANLEPLSTGVGALVPITSAPCSFRPASAAVLRDLLWIGFGQLFRRTATPVKPRIAGTRTGKPSALCGRVTGRLRNRSVRGETANGLAECRVTRQSSGVSLRGSIRHSTRARRRGGAYPAACPTSELDAALQEVVQNPIDASLVNDLDALGADPQLDPPISARRPESLVLQVRIEPPFRLVVRMRNVVARHRALPCDYADSCHWMIRNRRN